MNHFFPGEKGNKEQLQYIEIQGLEKGISA